MAAPGDETARAAAGQLAQVTGQLGATRVAVERGRRGTLGATRLVGQCARARRGWPTGVRLRGCTRVVQLWWWREAVPRLGRTRGRGSVLSRAQGHRRDASWQRCRAGVRGRRGARARPGRRSARPGTVGV
jgi:hypothetical protein